MTKSIKITLIIFAVIFLGFAYWKYSNRVTTTSDVAVNKENVSSGEEEKIFEILAVLKSIDIDVDFFKNKTLNSLTDFSRELVPEPVGRSNPFISQ